MKRLSLFAMAHLPYSKFLSRLLSAIALAMVVISAVHPAACEEMNWDEFVKLRAGGVKPEPGKIICIGSSHMALWMSVDKDLDPLKVYNFAVSGTTMEDAANEWAEKLVIPYQPRAVILYNGSNDIARGHSPDRILRNFRVFTDKIRTALPETRFYVLGIVPSPGQRFKKWDRIQQTNSMIEKECGMKPWFTYIDTTTILLGEEGKPRGELFKNDNVHMNPDGYKIWTAKIVPVVLASEKEHPCKE